MRPLKASTCTTGLLTCRVPAGGTSAAQVQRRMMPTGIPIALVTVKLCRTGAVRAGAALGVVAGTGSATGECETRASSSAPICRAASATSSRASPAAKFRSSACAGGGHRSIDSEPCAGFVRHTSVVCVEVSVYSGTVRRGMSALPIRQTPAVGRSESDMAKQNTCRAAYALTWLESVWL